jgi:cytochrome d ubiquinol oxidase subunit II
MDLALVCAGVIAFGVLMYVILDGFDLGIGILFPFMPDAVTRDTAIASIAPVWDGNETWLILGGAVLFGAFPRAYAIALPAFYVPLMLMMVALIFRGVAFEFRQKAVRTRLAWDIALGGGSTVAAYCQGLLLGGLLEGVTVKDGAFAGGAFDWLTPFSLTVGLGVVGGYALLGATWLQMKTEGRIREWAQRAALRSLVLTLLGLGVVSVYTPWAFPEIRERWFGDGHWVTLAPVPLATVIAAVSLLRELRRGATYAPFLYAIALFLLGYLGIGISLWPHIVPPSLTIWDAAAPRESQVFELVALAITLPMVLIYTGYAYYVFRGRIKEGAQYSH